MSEKIVIEQINASYNIPVLNEDVTYKEAQKAVERAELLHEHFAKFIMEFAMSISDHDMAIDKMFRTTRGYAGDLPLSGEYILQLAKEAYRNAI